MANQKSILKIEGTLDELTFYKCGSNYHVRRKGGVSAARIARDPAFARSRENSKEFGLCAKSGKTLRQAFSRQLIGFRDQFLIGRLAKIMHALKKRDATSVRGARNVGIGIEAAGAKELLKGFDFNNNAQLSGIFTQTLVLDPATGIMTLGSFDPRKQLHPPAGATHFAIRSVWARIDFVNNVFEQQESNIENRALDTPASDIILTPPAVPQGTGTDVFAILLEFFQEVNGEQYPLQNGRFNGFRFVEVV